MEAAGAGVSEMKERLGHKNLATTSRYLERLRRAENKHADTIAAMMGIDERELLDIEPTSAKLFPRENIGGVKTIGGFSTTTRASASILTANKSESFGFLRQVTPCLLHPGERLLGCAFGIAGQM
jgi:hypothetical protein